MAEKFRFQKGFRNRRAVELDEGALLPQAVEVDQPGNHLLAGAGFAGDQDRRLRRCDLNRGFDQARHRCRAADQVLPIESVGETLLEESILHLETAVLH